MTIWSMRIACWIINATHTHTHTHTHKHTHTHAHADTHIHTHTHTNTHSLTHSLTICNSYFLSTATMVAKWHLSVVTRSLVSSFSWTQQSRSEALADLST